MLSVLAGLASLLLKDNLNNGEAGERTTDTQQTTLDGPEDKAGTV
jgi:hypothetical protein